MLPSPCPGASRTCFPTSLVPTMPFWESKLETGSHVPITCLRALEHVPTSQVLSHFVILAKQIRN
jgi:hypothetical protein